VGDLDTTEEKSRNSRKAFGVEYQLRVENLSSPQNVLFIFGD
jgi:hypothetical protein